MMENVGRPVWAEVDLQAIAGNVREIRRLVRPQTEIMAVVKANGYGHGAVPVARVALENGVTRLGVATLGEALALREAGIAAPILILGYTPPEQAETAVAAGITQTVYSLAMADAVSRAALSLNKKASVHVKIDTGMGRIGFLPGPAAVAAICRIAELPGINLEGMFTHFAVADEQDKTYTQEQWAKFIGVIGELEKAGVQIPVKHAANSAAIMDLPETQLDLVRAGIILYGLNPSDQVDKERIRLKPAMSLKARVSFVKKLPKGASISYGRKYITGGETVIASLPLGYADGFPRALSNRADVLIRGQRVRVVGTVCMDQFMVDATAVPDVETGDEAVVFGSQGEEKISVEEVADRLGTINYEVVCMLSERVPRIYLHTACMPPSF